MNSTIDHDRAGLRKSIYAILIAVSTGMMLGRIFAVDEVDMEGLEQARFAARVAERRQQFAARGFSPAQIDQLIRREEGQIRRKTRVTRPFLSGNDRSRWATLRALVESKMRVPGAPYAIDKVIQEPGWDTIDMVKHDGRLYSSKPPLLPTLMAGQYWLIHKVSGQTLGTQPYAIGRTMLITWNVIPLLVYFWLLALMVERLGTSDWGRLFVMSAAAFGTFLTTFAVVLNNHILGAVSVAIVLYALIRIRFDSDHRARWFILAGLFAAFAVTNELPALAFLGAVGVWLLWQAPVRTLAAFVPAVVLVAAGFFGTNWIAHHSLRPPYAHRSETDPGDDWYRFTYERNGRVYQSYWTHPVGIDRGEPSVAAYVTHALVGHHGIFSLTPLWLLSVVGLFLWLWKPDDPRLRQLALGIGAVSLVCVAFYLARPLEDRNYGGMTSGFRWVFWFAPLWLVVMLPAVDRMAGRRWLRGLGLALLAISVLSASYPTWNPWTHPWLWDYLMYLRLIHM
jgi:hypothetical protein